MPALGATPLLDAMLALGAMREQDALEALLQTLVQPWV
jgi:hypothetical protein